MQDVLCIYYSRTGKTKKVMRSIAMDLDAELVELRDDVPRAGWRGWLRCGLDSMRKDCVPTKPLETKWKLSSYRLVILGTPIWAGRCSSVMRSFLKEHGGEIKKAAYVLTRGSEQRSENIYDQMDLYVPCGHCAAGSIRPNSVGQAFWQEAFLVQVREALNNDGQ